MKNLRFALVLLGAGILTGCQTTEVPVPEKDTYRSRLDASVLDAAKDSERRGDFATAGGYYRSAYDRDPKNLDAALGLTRMLRRTSHAREAVVIAERSLEVHKRNPLLMAELGKSQLAQNDTLLAIDTLSRAGSLLPDDWEIQSALGIGYDRVAMYDQAARRYEKALQLAPSNAVVLNNYALSLAQDGKLKHAIKLLEKASVMPESSVQMRQNLALLYAANGDVDAAERLVRRDLKPEVAAANMAYYRSLARQPGSFKERVPLPIPNQGVPGPESSLQSAPAFGSEFLNSANDVAPPAPALPVAPVRTAAPSAPSVQGSSADADVGDVSSAVVASAGGRDAALLPGSEAATTLVRDADQVRPVDAGGTTPSVPVEPSSRAADTEGQGGIDAPSAETASKPGAVPASPRAVPAKISMRSAQDISMTPANGTVSPVRADNDAAAMDAGLREALSEATEAQQSRPSNDRPLTLTPSADMETSAAVKQAALSADVEIPADVSAPASERRRQSLPVAPKMAAAIVRVPSGVKAPSRDGASDYSVQLGSYRSEAEANAGIAILRSAHDDILGPLNLGIKAVVLPERGRYFRILTAPLPSRGEATEVCEELQSRDVNCLILRQH